MLSVEQVPAKTPQRGQLVTWDAIQTFMFAGNARFTLLSLKTGMRYTYRVKVKKQDLENALQGSAITYFVETLRGPNNGTDYRYLGVLRQPGTLWFTQASQQLRGSPSANALIWFLDAMDKGRDVLGKSLEFWHEGRCCHCGRALTVPKSINDSAFNGGFGPECVKYFGGVQ